MDRRKVQLIGGTTYSISLPKAWARKCGLKQQSEVVVQERSDGRLLISAQSRVVDPLTEVTLRVSEHAATLEQSLHAIYNLGIEKIKIVGEGEISTKTLGRIRRSIAHMSGTEIIAEEPGKITIRVLLDKTKVDALQVLARLSLVVEQQIGSVLAGESTQQVMMNETESDRLYNLLTKMIQLSLVDSSILESSNFKHASLLPSYLLIAKKLENIGDKVVELSRSLSHKKLAPAERTTLEFIKALLGSLRVGHEQHLDQSRMDGAMRSAQSIKDPAINSHIGMMLRYLIDIHEQRIVLSYYKKLIDKDKL